jgi:integrase
VPKIDRVLSMILELAVKDGRIARNPADNVNLPRAVKWEHLYLTHEQVERLAIVVAEPYSQQTHAPHVDRAAANSYRIVVLFLAYTGVHWGEMAALRVGRINFLRRRASIVKSVTLVRGSRRRANPKATTDEKCRYPGSCSPSSPRMSPAKVLENSCSQA